jgi:hypothetical protein
MNRLLQIASVLEMTTGLALLVVPAFVVHLLLGGADIGGAAVMLARFAGIALLSMGAGWWPLPWRASAVSFNSLAALYLLGIGIRGDATGALLWPAVVIHGVLALLFIRAMARQLLVEAPR